MLNEYVLYEKYLSVLQEVGETKLTRTSSKIISEGMHQLEVNNFDYYTFVTLMSTGVRWNEVKEFVNNLNNKQESTLLLINTISKPMSEIFKMEQTWVKEKISRILEL